MYFVLRDTFFLGGCVALSFFAILAFCTKLTIFDVYFVSEEYKKVVFPLKNEYKNSSPDNICNAHYLLLNTDNQNNISYCFKSCKYDINAELKSNKTNFELDNYEIELTKGRYRNMERVNSSFEAQGYDVSKF